MPFVCVDFARVANLMFATVTRYLLFRSRSTCKHILRRTFVLVYAVRFARAAMAFQGRILYLLSKRATKLFKYQRPAITSGSKSS